MPKNAIETQKSVDEIPRILANILFGYVREMDREASNNPKDRGPRGLANVHRHFGALPWRFEHCWKICLTTLFAEDGMGATRDVPYPYSYDGWEKCDIVAQLPGEGALWLEVTQAWKAWFSDKGKIKKGNRRKYENHLFAPVAGGKRRVRTAQQDIMRLRELRRPEADYAGALLIGFDTIDSPMDAEVECLIEWLELVDEGWEVFGPNTWEDSNDSRCRINCWFLCLKP